MREPLKKCPECGGTLKLLENSGTRLQECTSCDYVIDLNTGEVRHIHVDKYVVVRCPSCKGMLHVTADYMLYEEREVDCPFCHTVVSLPDTVDKSIKTAALCLHCGKNSLVPANRGNIKVTCRNCQKKFRFYSGEAELLTQKENICPECGGEMESVRREGITIKQCTQCNYAVNTETGEIFHYALDEKYVIVPCPKCRTNVMVNADIRNDPHAVIGCPVCRTEYNYPEQVDTNLKLMEVCPLCGKENRVPANKGNLRVTCGHCGQKYDYYSGESQILRKETARKAPQQERPKQEFHAAQPQQKKERPVQEYQAEETTEQKGFFASIKEMFDQHKEEAEQEAADILGSDLAMYLKLALRDALLNRERDPKMRRFRAYRMYVHSSSMSLYGCELRGEPQVEGSHEALYIDFYKLPGTTKRVRHRLARRVLREELLRSVHGLNDRYFVKLDDALIWKLSE